jgi:hypothetical protein
MSVLHSYYEYGPAHLSIYLSVSPVDLIPFCGFKDFKITEMLNAVVSSRIQLHRGSIMHPQEKFEDTKGVICSSKSKKDTQYSGQNKKGQTTIR